MHTLPPVTQPGPPYAHDPAAWQPAHQQVAPGTAPNAGRRSTDPQYARATWPDPAWRTHGMPRVDSAATTNAYAEPSLYAPAPDLNRVVAPHRTALDATGDGSAPFTWPAPAPVQVHPWDERRDGADRHGMTWSDPICDALPHPDHDPHGAVGLLPLPPPPSALIATTRPHPWPRARVSDDPYAGHYHNYHEPHRAASRRRRDQQDLWHADPNARLLHTSALDTCVVRFESLAVAAAATVADCAGFLGGHVTYRRGKSSCRSAREERDMPGLGSSVVARDVPPPLPPSAALAAPSPPFSPPTARRAAHAVDPFSAGTGDAPLVPPPTRASWTRASWTHLPAARFSTADDDRTPWPHHGGSTVHNDRAPWPYHGGASRPADALDDRPSRAPEGPSAAPVRAHRDRPWYGAPYSPWSGGYSSHAPTAPSGYAASTSAHGRRVSPTWHQVHDGTWPRHDRAGQATWPPAAATVHGSGPWRPTSAGNGLGGNERGRKHAGDAYGDWHAVDDEKHGWAAAGGEDASTAQNGWMDVHSVAWATDPRVPPALDRVTAWTNSETVGPAPWGPAWSGADHGGDGGAGVRGADVAYNGVVPAPDRLDNTAPRDSALQNEFLPRHPPAPRPPQPLPETTTTVHEPTADVTAAHGSTSGTSGTTRPDAGQRAPVSIPPHGASASASASAPVASPPRAAPARRVHDGGGPGGPLHAGPTGASDRALLAVVKNRRRRAHLPTGARATLLAWVEGHRESPYPTRTEKDQLMAATGLSLTQVENFFVNFRRRSLKKFSAPRAPTHPDRPGEPAAPIPPMSVPSALDVHAHALLSVRPLMTRSDHNQFSNSTHRALPPAPHRGS
ncbi:hypothetical protein AMAG_12457 [Allomyces macrogynus ATCC 38327]|uniref:Homeobox domain-containing protein n=1 Tax=Allomyces macrogynus (strain ATCC 38327) TaxID=578462 RepID=A0A0L0SYZ6_ALLM3|nr:hypothetical protein AMAG_12457 [Allomyces macrogynus ATCC 38327]|eukprot:KNE67727.1 hypothetical protein AMAG_12457 [Allomyces macrogynus ATCC 38327]